MLICKELEGLLLLKVITNRKQIDDAQRQFVDLMKSNLDFKTERTLGFKGDNLSELVYYDDTIGLWFAPSKYSDGISQYWNPFGTQTVSKYKDLNIIVEINFPFKLDRRAAGIFLEDGDGEIFIGHRGKVGGGRKGIGKNAFMQYYKGSRSFVKDGNTETEVFIISALGSPRLVENIKAFADSVEMFKRNATNGMLPDKNNLFNLEPERRNAYTVAETIDSEMLHGSVVNALYAKFNQLSATVKNTRYIDLMIVSETEKITHIFEIKSRSDLQSIYTAIGQLKFHAQRLRTDAKQIIVVPKTISDDSKSILNELGIHVVIFAEEEKQIKFFGLESV